MKRNSHIREELKVEGVNGIIIKYKESWENSLAEWGVTDSPRYPYCISRKGREAWEDPRRDGPTSCLLYTSRCV